MKRDNNDPEALGVLIMRHAKLHDCRFTTAADRVYQALAAGTDPLLAPLPEARNSLWSTHSSAPPSRHVDDGSRPWYPSENGAQRHSGLAEGEADFVD